MIEYSSKQWHSSGFQEYYVRDHACVSNNLVNDQILNDPDADCSMTVCGAFGCEALQMSLEVVELV